MITRQKNNLQLSKKWEGKETIGRRFTKEMQKYRSKEGGASEGMEKRKPKGKTYDSEGEQPSNRIIIFLKGTVISRESIIITFSKRYNGIKESRTSPSRTYPKSMER